MPATLEKPKPALKTAHEEVLHSIISDFTTRLKEAPVGTAFFTALNFAVSLIPSASFLVSDAVLARIVERFDPKFKLTYDPHSESPKGEALRRIFTLSKSSNEAEQQMALQMLRAIRVYAQNQNLKLHPVGDVQKILKWKYNVDREALLRTLKQIRPPQRTLQQIHAFSTPAKLHPRDERFLREQALKHRLLIEKAAREAQAPRRLFSKRKLP